MINLNKKNEINYKNLFINNKEMEYLDRIDINLSKINNLFNNIIHDIVLFSDYSTSIMEKNFLKFFEVKFDKNTNYRKLEKIQIDTLDYRLFIDLYLFSQLFDKHYELINFFDPNEYELCKHNIINYYNDMNNNTLCLIALFKYDQLIFDLEIDLSYF